MAKQIINAQSYKSLKFSALEDVIDDLCCDVSRSDILKNKRCKIITFGSCFAENVAKALAQKGYAATPMTITEYVNTPRANLHFLKLAFEEHVENEFPNDNDNGGKLSRDTLLKLNQAIVNADAIIFTLGIAYDWVRKSDGASVLVPSIRNLASYDTRYSPVQSQVEIIKEIISFLRVKNPNARVIITLSPVPLEFSLRYKSAVISDCVSKSILRAAIHECSMAEKDSFTYFPTFEFFRWASGHSNRAFYGADGNIRHVDADLVEIAVNKFIEINGGG